MFFVSAYNFTIPPLLLNGQTQAVSCTINDTMNSVIHQTHVTAAHLLNKHISDFLSNPNSKTEDICIKDRQCGLSALTRDGERRVLL